MSKDEELKELTDWLGAVRRWAAERVRLKKSEISYGSDATSASMVKVCERELSKLTRFGQKKPE